MSRFKYCIIGKNWGKKINRILFLLNKQTYIFSTDKKYLSNEYFEDLKIFILKKKINILWIAIPPLQLEKFLLNFFKLKIKIDLILEKPLIFKKNFLDKKKCINFVKNNFIFVNFEFLFLKKIRKIKKTNIMEIDFNFHTKMKSNYQINPIFNLGCHLYSIKEFFFSKIKKVNIYVSEGVFDKRNILIKYHNRTKEINFTNNKELILQKFIKYCENTIKYKSKNLLNFNLGLKITNQLKNIKKIN